MSSNVVVAVRVRPPNSNEIGSGDAQRAIIQHIGDGCILFDPPYTHAATRAMPGTRRSKNMKYKFDHFFEDDATQEEVYQATAKKVVDKVVAGFNACVFAYGATGSGKTHSMVGTESDPGIMVRTVDDLFARIGELAYDDADTDSVEPSSYRFEVSLTYLEVYCETIKDLLSTHQHGGHGGARSDGLPLHEDNNGVMSVRGLTEKRNLKSTAEVFHLLREGNSRRTQCATDQNHQSSRSHAVLQIVVKKFRQADTPVSSSSSSSPHTELWTSKLSLIDLAGSERAAASTNRGTTQKEGTAINKSLLALGNVINQLAARSKASQSTTGGSMKGGVSRKAAGTPAPTARVAPAAGGANRPKTAAARSTPTAPSPPNSQFVAYRGSKLTRLLKDSLGGECITVMLAAVSPSSLSLEDTHNTLKYADRAKQIKVEARSNEANMRIINAKLQSGQHAAVAAAANEQMKQLQTQLTSVMRENAALKLQLERSRLNGVGPLHSSPSSSSSFDLDRTTSSRLDRYRQCFSTIFAEKDVIDAEMIKLKSRTLRMNVWLGLLKSQLTNLKDKKSADEYEDDDGDKVAASDDDGVSRTLASSHRHVAEMITKLTNDLTESNQHLRRLRTSERFLNNQSQLEQLKKELQHEQQQQQQQPSPHSSSSSNLLMKLHANEIWKDIELRQQAANIKEKENMMDGYVRPNTTESDCEWHTHRGDL